jgi:hypothetical protein
MISSELCTLAYVLEAALMLLLLCDDDNIYAMPKPTALWTNNLLRAMYRTSSSPTIMSDVAVCDRPLMVLCRFLS